VAIVPYEVGGAMSPTKSPPEPLDTQNALQASQNRLYASRYLSKPPPICLRAPHFGPNKRNLAFTFSKNPFYIISVR